MIREKKFIIFMFLILGILLSGFFSGCQETQGTVEEQKAVFPLTIWGDVDNPWDLHKKQDAPDIYEIERRGEKIEVIALSELIDRAQPRGDAFDILFTAHDGFSVLISGKNIAESYIALGEEDRWEAINSNHPRSSNIKNIKDIVIISRSLPLGAGFNVINPVENLAQLSIGDFYEDGFSVFPAVRGTAFQIHEDEELKATSFYRHRQVDIENYVDLSGADSAVVVGHKGEVEPYEESGRLVLQDNSLGYMQNNELLIPEARGLVLNPPDRMITDVYHDTKTLLKQEEKILMILIDGLGYHQFEYARENGYIPFLESLPQPEKAMVAYPPVTPVNVAASLTGELPYINGVYERGIRRTQVPTIFAYTEEQGLSAAAVIGPMGTIELEIDPIYTVRSDEAGRNDHKKTENALEEMNEELRLLFVHYKDVDRAGHNYGDLASKTMQEIERTDGYVQSLLQVWEGKVLIYADHGMHATEEGGDHRHLIFEDMFMPYWLLDGGNWNE